jgi:maleate isomerase
MEKTAEVAALEQQLDAVLATLLRESGGSRCTLRIDDRVRGWNVDFICAEAIRPGVKSLRGEGSIDQRGAATVKWMVANKRNLLQGDLLDNPNPAPPAALLSVYAAKAQMLSPLFGKDGYLNGWISVHYVDGSHAFSASDENALDKARTEVKRLTGIGS